MFKFTCAASTKTGKRPVNQDNYMLGNLYAPQDHADLRNNAQGKTDHPFFVAVADGMGGEASGEKASFETVRVLAAVSNRLRNDFESNKRIVHDSVLQANDAICNVMRNENIRSMGSTVVTLLLQDDKCSYTNLGDSRLYMLRNGELVQLTKDHTEGQAMVDAHVLTEEQLKTHPSRNRLSRHLGISREDMMIDTPVYPDITLQDNDKFLICSDGVCGVLSKEEMSKILSMSATTVAKAEILVASSIDAGSRDNVTALVVEIAADEADSTDKVKKQIKQTAINNRTSSNGIKNKFLVAIFCVLFFVVGILVGIGISPKTSKPETDVKENVRPGSSHTQEETPTIYPMSTTEPICTPSELPHEQPLVFSNKDFENAIREALSLADDDIITNDMLNSKLNSKKELNLSEKGLSNISDIGALANLTNLQTLNLSGNSISDIGALANLTNLTELKLSGNKFISDISALGNLTNLQTLNLSYNNISDISALANLTNLQTLKTLNLSGNGISDISALESLKNLQTLTLINNNISDVNPLVNLSGLRWLDLSKNPLKKQQVEELRQKLLQAQIYFD